VLQASACARRLSAAGGIRLAGSGRGRNQQGPPVRGIRHIRAGMAEASAFSTHIRRRDWLGDRVLHGRDRGGAAGAWHWRRFNADRAAGGAEVPRGRVVFSRD